MKNKEKIQLLEHRLNIHSELLERIISKLEFDSNEHQLKQLDHSVFNGLDSKWEYAAVDANGEAHLYTHHIIPDSVEFAYCDAMDFDCQTIGTDYDVIDWKNSLIKRESKPQLKQLDHSIFDGLEDKWRFAAVDKGGEVWVYSGKPERDHNFWHVKSSVGMSVGEDYDASNWKESLIKRETNELTGSELCKAMLARGDKYVLCLVNDNSEESAKSYERVRVICSQGADYFDDTTEDMWYFAIPINSQGKPLTSSDVGL